MQKARWKVFNSAGLHAEALAAAEEGDRVVPGMRWNLQESLIDLGRFEDARYLYGRDPRSYRQGVWDIGFLLVYRARYEDALTYLEECLAFAKLPLEYAYLFAFIECLLLAGQNEQARLLALFWLDARNGMQINERRILDTYASLAFMELGDHPTAAKHLSSARGRMSRNGFVKRIRRGLVFYSELLLPRVQKVVDLFSDNESPGKIVAPLATSRSQEK